jgi:hypothetical protein
MPMDPALCVPEEALLKHFNSKAEIPFGVKARHIHHAMKEFTDFLGFIDTQLCTKKMARFEEMLMPANFSSLVGEFMSATIPKHCKTVVKNNYHNGHPDVLPAGKYPKNAAQHAGADGIEIKASRYLKAWQGHNVEDVWLMVFMFAGGRPSDAHKGIKPIRFRFLAVYGAMLKKADWKFAGRSATSRRTITASVTDTGYVKMLANWIYKAPSLTPEAEATLILGDGDE